MANRVRVCPNCGSDQVGIDSTDFVSILGLDPKATCKECGYTGKLFPTVPEDRKEEHRKHLEDVEEEEPGEAALNIDDRRSWKKVAAGVGMLLLGAGSIPYATQSLIGVGGTLLIVPGLSTLYNEYKKR